MNLKQMMKRIRYMAPADDGGSAGGTDTALSARGAGDAISALLDGGADEHEPQEGDSPDAAAEKLAKRELSSKEAPADAEDADADPDAQVSDEDVTIEIDGKPVKLTKAELVENYKNGLRQADYTRKTMEAAEAKKGADAEVQKARQDRSNYANQLNNYAIQANGEIKQLLDSLTDELLTADPMEYLIRDRTVKQRQAQAQDAQNQLAQLQKDFDAEQKQASEAHMAEQGKLLLAALPDWKDAEKATAESKQIKEFLGSMGFNPGEQQFGDHRLVLMARKAMLHDQLYKRAGEAVKRVTAVPTKVERAGSTESRPDGRTEAMKNLSKTGSIKDAAKAFESFFK